MTEIIELKNLLPNVFRGMENTERISTSQIWEVPSFVFRRGCRLCIHADSGAGKTSLLSFIFGNRNDYKGSIYYDGVDIKDFSDSKWCEIRQNDVALLPQEMRLFPQLTVMQNIQIKNCLTNQKSEDEILEMLSILGIEDKLNTPVSRLSIGQQQRCAVVRTLCQPFSFIFLDEPVSHLDINNNRIVASLVEREAGKYGAGIISTSVGVRLLIENAEEVEL